jgi:hypothetical protein
LKELKYPKQAKPGEPLVLAMRWQNTGSAPCYRPYRLAYRLTDGDGNHRVIIGGVTVNEWLPGEVELFTEEFLKQPADLPPGKIVDVADTIRLPNDLPPGTYRLSLAVVGEEHTEPVVQLGIEGRSDDGGYPLSTVTISR